MCQLCPELQVPSAEPRSDGGGDPPGVFLTLCPPLSFFYHFQQSAFIRSGCHNNSRLPRPRGRQKSRRDTAGHGDRPGTETGFQMSACQESLLDPCFDLKFVEEKADTTLDLIYQKISVWDEPARGIVSSTSNTVVVMLTLWNLEPNSSIFKYTQVPGSMFI